jgi:translin
MIQENLLDLSTARDSIFEFSRISISSSGNAIVELHRGNIEKAATHLRNAEGTIRDLEGILRKWKELKYLGNVTVAYQEYAEAKILYGIITKNRLLSLKEVDVKIEPYLLGLLDFLGELRRRCRNFLKKGELADAENVLRIMEGIHEDLYSIDHTRIISGFRHKMDTARKLIEITRGDVVNEFRRLSLENALKSLEKRLTKSGSQKASSWNE